jgi:hypothetical protein
MIDPQFDILAKVVADIVIFAPQALGSMNVLKAYKKFKNAHLYR